MARSNREKLDALDITKITLTDVFALKNDVLRRVLLDAISMTATPPEHHSHATHSNHYQSIAVDAPIDIVSPQADRDTSA